MPSIPAKVIDRLIAGIKRFQPILTDAKRRDVGEADTVNIIRDMLQDVFGYDKFTEVTAEQGIKNSNCDLAIKLNGTIATLIEAKAVGIELKDNHVYQAVNYAANQGVTWVILTNAITWRVYRVAFSKPISQELVVDLDFLCLKPKDDYETLYLWSKEGWTRTALDEYEAQQQARSPILIAATILSDPVLDEIRRQLKRVSKLNKDAPDIKIENGQIEEVLRQTVIKREVLEDARAVEARKKVAKASGLSLHTESKSKDRKEPDCTPGPTKIPPSSTTPATVSATSQ
jgi:predicted type IV restriction endonuclease